MTAVPEREAAPPPAAAHRDAWSRERLEGWFRGGAFVILLLVAAIATLRLYVSLESAIITWLRPQWVPLAQAAFSLVMLAVAVWLIRAWIIGRAR